MLVTDDSEVWQYTTQVVHAVLPSRAKTLKRRVWSCIALGGAAVVIVLYLIVPLMIFFSIFHDLLTQFLVALLFLTIGEFIVFGILVKTSVPIQKDAGKRPDTIRVQPDMTNISSNNVPFDVIVNTSTTRVSAVQPQQKPVLMKKI